jgi:Arc/MetJ-type ribon-helix-helix transcriptional regulator
MSEQLTVRISDELAGSLEDLVEGGRFETKAEAVRRALETLVDLERRRRVGDLIVQGYSRLPQGEEADLDLVAAETLHALETEEAGRGLEW